MSWENHRTYVYFAFFLGMKKCHLGLRQSKKTRKTPEKKMNSRCTPESIYLPVFQKLFWKFKKKLQKNIRIREQNGKSEIWSAAVGLSKKAKEIPPQYREWIKTKWAKKKQKNITYRRDQKLPRPFFAQNQNNMRKT